MRTACLHGQLECPARSLRGLRALRSPVAILRLEGFSALAEGLQRPLMVATPQLGPQADVQSPDRLTEVFEGDRFLSEIRIDFPPILSMDRRTSVDETPREVLHGYLWE